MNISQVYKASLEIAARTSGTSAIKALNADLVTTGKTADAVNKQMASLNGGLRTLAAGFGGVQVADFISDMARATIQLDAFQAQLSIGFDGANRLELMALRAQMKGLGLAQEEGLGSAVRFTSAMKLSGQTIREVNENFAAASKLILSNKLPAEGAERVFKAMQQTASKGKLMAEELNGQLGDTLAGFNGQLAEAMGISTGDLLKQMSDGKVSAEEFFVALRKIGDGIDDSKLNSAARSLGNLKNQWFDFKSSVLKAETVKAALDGTAASFKFLADNVTTLTSVVKGLAVGFGTLMAVRLLTPVVTTLATAIWALTFSFRTYGVAQTFAINGSIALRAAWTALAANPIGLAMTALALIFGALAMQTKAADEAASAYGRAQNALAGVIDITSGKLIKQNGLLLENARLLAKTALLKARDAETEARGGFERRIGVVSGVIAGAQTFGAPTLQGKAEADDFVMRMRRGEIATADVSKGWDSLLTRFPDLKREYGDVSKEVGKLTEAQVQLRDATIQNEIVLGRVGRLSKADLEYARERGILAVDPTAPATTSSASSPASTSSAADPYGDRLTALRGQAIQLQFQAENFGRYGERVESAEQALMQFEVTSGKFKDLLPEQKRNLLDAAQAVDDWRLKLEAAKVATKAMNDLAQDRTELQFQIDHFAEYGEKIETAREAAMRFRTTQGDLKGLGDAEKKRLLDEAKAVDALAESYDVLKRRKGEQQDLARAIVGWSGEADDVRFRAQRSSMSEFDFQQAADRRQALREIERESIGMTAEGAAEYRKARLAALELVQAEERLAEQRRNTWGGGFREAVRSYGEEIANIGQMVGDAWAGAFRGTEDALVNMLTTGKADFRSLATSILADMARIMIRATIMAPLVELLKSVGLDPNAGGADVVNSEGAKSAAAALTASAAAWGAVVLGLKSAAADLAAAPATSVGGGGTTSLMSFFGFSNGGAFDRTGITAFANGGVVNSPTMFRHAGGVGVMGEAGAEAVMPLRRINGKLGVAASGGGDTVINVEVNVDKRGAATTATSGEGQNAAALGKLVGVMVKQVLVDESRPGGLLAG